MLSMAPCWLAIHRPDYSQAVLRQQLPSASQLAFRAPRSRRLRQATSAGSLRLAKDSKVHPTIESKTTCGRLVPWNDRAQRFVPPAAQVDQRGESSRRCACIADTLSLLPTRGAIAPACIPGCATPSTNAGRPARDSATVPPTWFCRKESIFRRMPTALLADVSC